MIKFIIKIGRNNTNDIVVPDEMVTRECHCRIICDDSGHFFVEDRSTNGTFINGIRIATRWPHPLLFNDILKIGRTPLPWRNYVQRYMKDDRITKVMLMDDGSLREYGQVNGNEGISIPIPKNLVQFDKTKVISIGRVSDNDIVINDPLVSRHHLQIAKEGGRYWVVDLGSTNGTYVNGVRVQGRVEVDITAMVKIGNTVLPWQRYFSIKPKKHGPLLWVPIGIGAILILALFITLIVAIQEDRIDATVGFNKIFSGKEISKEVGKPHKIIYQISDRHNRKNIMAKNVPTRDNDMTEENSRHTTTVYYADKNGKLYETFAVPGHILLYFRKETGLARQKEIIHLCGGKILENHAPTNYYLVRVRHGEEASFMSKARRYQEVKDVYVDQLSDVTEARIEIIDDFKTPIIKNYNYSHGSYVATSAKSAYPDCPTCIIPNMHDVNGSFSNDRIASSLTSIFEKHKGDAPILINMSFGQYIYRYKNTAKGPKRTSEEIKWIRTFSDSLGRYARKSWITNYVLSMRFILRHLEALHEAYPKTDFIVTKSTGNNGCHELDTYVLKPLRAELSEAQNRIMNEHFFLVSAKDDDSSLPGELNASYADAPKFYHPWVTTVDISHLKHDGTSFAAPLLLGYIARRLDTESDVTARKVVTHIKTETRKDAINNQRQPGLFAIGISRKYAYERIYQFEGVLHRGAEDLCGTGVQEFYYLQMEPTEFYDASGVEEVDGGWPSAKVTRMQVSLPHASVYVGKRIKVVGSPLCHLIGSGCHIHTDVYMVDAMVVRDNERQK